MRTPDEFENIHTHASFQFSDSNLNPSPHVTRNWFNNPERAEGPVVIAIAPVFVVVEAVCLLLVRIREAVWYGGSVE
jgi:hypothetical protein